MQSTAASPRYVVSDQTTHCCFDSTVRDTHTPVLIGGRQWVGPDGNPEYRVVCECPDRADAERIAAALNAAQAGDHA